MRPDSLPLSTAAGSSSGVAADTSGAPRMHRDALVFPLAVAGARPDPEV